MTNENESVIEYSFPDIELNIVKAHKGSDQFTLEPFRSYVIGIDKHCDIVIDRAHDNEMSSIHFAVEVQETGVFITDQSTNGTIVDQTRLNKNGNTVHLVDLVRLAQVGTNGVLVIAGKTHIEVLYRGMTTVPISSKEYFGLVKARSKAMRHLFYLLELAAKRDETVFLTGETGTGKTSLAKEIHNIWATECEPSQSKRPFVKYCCGTAGTLVESDLFGHVRGAYTSASTTRIGRIGEADNGTLFLDEISELSYDNQKMLLSFLDRDSNGKGTYRPLGGKRDLEANVRLIVASNKDLKKLVAEGKFRSDLYYRLDELSFNVPPLRARIEDIELIIDDFIVRTKAIENLKKWREGGGVQRFKKRVWEGNIRELLSELKYIGIFGRERREIHQGTPNPPKTIGIKQQNTAAERYIEELFSGGKWDELVDKFKSKLANKSVERHGSIAKAAEALGCHKDTISTYFHKK